MRIVFLIGALSGGGAEAQVVNLAKGLRRRGHKVTVVTLWSVQSKEKKGLEGAGILCVSLAGGQSSYRPMRWAKFLLFPGRLRRVLRDERPHILYSMLHFTNALGWLGAIGSGRITLVWGVRASNMKLNLSRRLPERVCRLLSPTVSLMIANSYAGAEWVKRVKKFRPKRIEVVDNGIDTEAFAPVPGAKSRIRREFDIPNDAPVVGLVGRMDPMKGHDLFLRAAGMVLKSQPECRFLIVGGGPEKYVSYIGSRIGREGVIDRVHLSGDRNDMAEVYSALDVLCLPSRYGEGWPNVVGEAMASGTVCVVSDVGDAARIVGGEGFVVTPGDAPELAKRVCDALGAGRLRPRDRILDNYRIQYCCDKTERLFTCEVGAK